MVGHAAPSVLYDHCPNEISDAEEARLKFASNQPETDTSSNLHSPISLTVVSRS